MGSIFYKIKNKSSLKKDTGFTLIELLVVLAIIALLLIAIVATMSYLQERGRDTNRLQDLHNIITMLETYQTSHNHFPQAASGTIILNGTDKISRILKQDNLGSVPLDPLHPTYSYSYDTNETATRFELHFCLETNSLKPHEKGCKNILTK